jgi:hypothetical protein
MDCGAVVSAVKNIALVTFKIALVTYWWYIGKVIR